MTSNALNSANSGVIVMRTGQLRADYGSAGRQYARDFAEQVNSNHLATALLYEETFGTKNRVHWLIHAESFDTYEKLLGLSQDDGSWTCMFVDGGVRELVLMPQSFGMYGTADEKPDTVLSADGESPERFMVPTATHQCGQSEADLLHSGNCGILIHRFGELRYEFRAEGRQFARALGESWNASLAGHATIFLYEEVFGRSDRIHWLVHLRSLADYYLLMGLRARVDPAAREVFTKQWIPAEKGSGGWERLFVQGSLQDVALSPQQ